jgi:hypothetical protein
MGEKQINPIDKATVRQFFNYENGELIWAVDKGRAKIGQKAHINSTGYKVFKINGTQYLEHRLIWAWHNDTVPDYLDHINGNFLDNSIENLREATHQQNMCNRKTPKHNKSGVKGVYKQKNRWRAQITANGVMQYLGSFINLDDAKSAVINARNKLHKNFANLGA